MALFEELTEEVLGPVALGVGAVILIPTLFPAVGRMLRPLTKGVIKTGIAVYDQSYAAVAETYASVAETTGDLVAEVRAERETKEAKTKPSAA